MQIKIIHSNKQIKSSLAFKELEEKVNEFIKKVKVKKIKFKKDFRSVYVIYK